MVVLVKVDARELELDSACLLLEVGRESVEDNCADSLRRSGEVVCKGEGCFGPTLCGGDVLILNSGKLLVCGAVGDISGICGKLDRLLIFRVD